MNLGDLYPSCYSMCFFVLLFTDDPFFVLEVLERLAI